MRTERQTNHNNWLEWHMAIEVGFGEVVLCVMFTDVLRKGINLANQYLLKIQNLEHVPLWDLGIFIDNNLAFIPHTKTNHIKSYIFPLPPETELFLPKHSVNTFDCYWNIVLCGIPISNILKYLVQGIESVQRRFTRVMIPSLRHQPFLTRF